ncbi:accessory gland protein Acp29AB-like [Drosophila kikkawai]|uniref:Accessory gland protein Acp29AB-like n=1 Tax=Drosophila kikkawai TaxID=30033 RepID=A0ABM4GI10_DROKI
MLKLIVGFGIIATCHLASGSVIPAVWDTLYPIVPEAQPKVESTAPGFSSNQMSELTGICLTALKIMIDKTPNGKEIDTTPPPKQEVITAKTVAPGFEMIGARIFYIEREVHLSWFAAEIACREMGGKLATIQDEEELSAFSKTLQSKKFWVDVGHLFYKLSPDASEEEYEEKGEGERCISLFQSNMNRENCENKNLFICETVDEYV